MEEAKNLEAKYMQLRQEYSGIMQKAMEIEDEKKEHSLVFDTISKLEPDRKCWRMVGGVLIERTVGEVAPALKTNIDQMDSVLKSLQNAIKQKDAQLKELELRVGKKSSGTRAEDAREAAKQKSGGGVLV